MKRFLALLALGLAATMTQAHEFTLGDLEVIHPNIPLPAPGAMAAAGYMVVANDSHAPERLVAVRSALSERVMMHVTEVDANGVAKMHPLQAVDIPENDSAAFEPGGRHIMFMGLTADLHEGDRVPATLVFESAGEMAVEFVVGPADRAAGHAHADHAAMDHSSMQHSAATHSAMDHGSMDHSAMAGMSDPEQIRALLMGTFDRPGAPLTVEPITLRGPVAVAGWSQGGQGGRAFLRKDADGWFVELCSGQSLVDAATFVGMGLGHADAELLAAEVNGAEAPLGAAFIARLNSFEGTVVIGRQGHDHQH
ncbi:copper uptake system-associated protein [Antarcticimicrobium luteum]|uniref:Copper chaperone PCu(A)C n=1 Tax=Antarcticimicrobium luteum TaxID=2547397 RepID=A0A4R5V5I0_9RHOB|nr:copper uptake system-associated protein [Antarcticimicrobium luteum]TDK46736.1 copper chaperone PCu(A)C [Antarcticimicrobium luteum]